MEKLIAAVENEDKVKPWKATLFLDNLQLSNKRTTETKDLLGPTDIFSLHKDDEIKIYLDLEKYCKPDHIGEVLRDIKYLCNKNGYSINQSGYAWKKVNDNVCCKVYRFKCVHQKQWLYFREKKLDVDPRKQPKGRRHSIMADKKNSRTNGQTLPRMTNTERVCGKCNFKFQIYYDEKGFVFDLPEEINTYHVGHKMLPPNEITIRKGAMCDYLEKRVIEDTKVAISITATQRVLNLVLSRNGPFITKSLIRGYRHSCMLYNSESGETIDQKDKSEIDCMLELLESYEARVTYLVVKPTLKKERDDLPSKLSIVSSQPCRYESSNVKHNSFFVTAKGDKLGLDVIKNVSNGFFRIVSIKDGSDLEGLVETEDHIMSINQKEVKSMKTEEFVSYIASLVHSEKILEVTRSSIGTLKTDVVQEEKSLCRNLEYHNGKGKIFTPKMYEELEKIANKYRKKEIAEDANVELFMSIAWILPESWQIVNLHSHTIFLDTTFNVNMYSDYRQFSLVVKDGNGSAYVIARIGLPHEKEYLLSYCIEVVIPALCGKLFPKRVRVILTDGCPWLCSAVDRSLLSVYTKACRRRCGWHLVSKSFDTNVAPFLSYHPFCPCTIIENFPRLLLNWIYSWCRPVCYSKQEYDLSVQLLFDWLHSENILTYVCPRESVVLIANWLKTSVLPYEEYYAFYRYKHVFHVNNYTCCCIEGTHNGLKNNSVGVSRKDSLLAYTKKSLDYDVMNFHNKFAAAAASREKSHLFGKAWMNGLCGRAALLTFNMIQHSENYVSKFREMVQGLPVFDVICKEEIHDQDMFISDDPHDKVEMTSTSTKEDGYDFALPKSHPKFRHAWSVMLTKTISGELILVCNCSLFENSGLVCCHCHHVFRYHLEEHEVFAEISWHHFSPRWWKISDYLIQKSPKEHTEAEKKILYQILELADDDSIVGIRLDFKSHKTLDSVLKCKWSKELCKGTEVTDTGFYDPFEVRAQHASLRIKNWDTSSISNDSELGMVPEYRVEDNTVGIDETRILEVNVAKAARTQETNKKEVLSLIYDICEKVDFANEEEYFSRLLGSLEGYHSEAIKIALRGTPTETGNGVLSRSFAGTKVATPNRVTFHVFSTPKKKRRRIKKGSPSVRDPRNMSSP